MRISPFTNLESLDFINPVQNPQETDSAVYLAISYGPYNQEATV
jgi:hypothetical protein